MNSTEKYNMKFYKWEVAREGRRNIQKMESEKKIDNVTKQKSTIFLTLQKTFFFLYRVQG